MIQVGGSGTTIADFPTYNRFLISPLTEEPIGLEAKRRRDHKNTFSCINVTF